MSDEPIDSELDRISDRLRTWREERGLSRHELAELSGVAASTVHKVESRQMTPSISVLLKLAHGLGRRPAEILADVAPPSRVAIHRATDADVATTGAATFERLSGDVVAPELESWRVSFDPQASSGRPIRFDGEVLLVCHDGELTVAIGEQAHVLGPGDAAHFKAELGFSYRNDGARPAQFAIHATLPGELRRSLQRVPLQTDSDHTFTDRHTDHHTDRSPR